MYTLTNAPKIKAAVRNNPKKAKCVRKLPMRRSLIRTSVCWGWKCSEAGNRRAKTIPMARADRPRQSAVICQLLQPAIRAPQTRPDIPPIVFPLRYRLMAVPRTAGLTSSFR